MRRISCCAKMIQIRFIMLLLFSLWLPVGVEASALVADHTRTVDISDAEIALAKSNLHIAYGHTSHGSQLVTGMAALQSFNSKYAYSSGGSNGSLDLRDGAMGGDVGYYPDWYNNTRSYLGTSDPVTGRGQSQPAINVIIWSWCGQAASYSAQDMIDKYLTPMSNLEKEYPGVQFVYMTGHLNGDGASGNLHLRNNQIREFAQQNNKVLFDFADIESYDPSGNEFYTRLANDNCDYDSDNNSSRDENWAVQWLADPANQYSPLKDLAENLCGDCAHSQKLNCVQKGRAVWWLWAQLAKRQNLQVKNGGNGSVSSSPAGIVCGDDCGEFYIKDSSVTLTATPNSGYLLNGWGGDCSACGKTNSCSVTLDQARSCQVTFTPAYTLTVSRAGSGGGTVRGYNPGSGIDCGTSCSASFAAGASIPIQASPDGDSVFTGWAGTGCNSCPWTSNICAVTMDSNKSCTAYFEPASVLVVQKDGNGRGRVTSTDAVIDCGDVCYGYYPRTATVTLTATPEAGSVFIGWQGACEGGSCTLLMYAARHNVLAVFNQEDKCRTGEYSYGTISNAYAAVGSNSTIRARALDMHENLLFNRGIPFSLLGGYASGYATVSGVTSIYGNITIGGSGNQVILSRIVIR